MEAEEAIGSVLRVKPKDLQDCGIDTFADLFCGIGGFHYAAENLGLNCVFASDLDAAAQDQYEQNFGFRPSGDITKIPSKKMPDHDILFAGFPCQPFSIIGDRKGTKDERGGLVFDVIRILKDKQPKAAVLENVKQFATINGGKLQAEILREIEGLGYGVDTRILNALHYGLPQKRERVIIVALLDGIEEFKWPTPKKKYKPLAEVLEEKPDRRYFVSERILKSRKAAHKSKHKPAIWHENKSGNISSYPYSCALRAGASYNYLLVDGKRRLTSREQLRLQGFPERFKIIGSEAQLRKQAGNAVPVPMVRAVIREVLHAAAKSEGHGTDSRALSA